MRRWARLALGGALVAGGLALALLETGVLLIADCGPGCVARGERLLVGALALAGLLVAAAGGRLLWTARARPRASSRKA